MPIPIAGHENDNIVIFTRKHIVSLFGTMFLILVMILLPIFVFFVLKTVNHGFLTGHILNFIVVAVSIYYLITATFAFTQWVSYYYDIFVVTDDEILDIDQQGIFDRRVTEISLLRIQDVSARVHGFFATFFNYGDVVAESAGENTRTYIIDSVPNPIAIANKILDLHNEHVAKEERAGEMKTADGDLRGGPIRSAASTSAQTCPPCPPCEVTNNQNDNSPFAIDKPLEIPDSHNISEPTNHEPGFISEKSQSSEGNVSKDDLDQGGEVKL